MQKFKDTLTPYTNIVLILIVDTGVVTARLLIKVKPIDIFSLEKAYG